MILTPWVSEPTAVVTVLDRAFGESVKLAEATCIGTGASRGVSLQQTEEEVVRNKCAALDGTRGLRRLWILRLTLGPFVWTNEPCSEGVKYILSELAAV